MALDSRLITVPQWTQLCWSVLDVHPSVRWAVLSVATSCLRAKLLPMRWVMVPALACADVSGKGAAFRRAGRDALMQAMAVFRLLQLQQSRPGSPVLPFAVMPEFCLPFAVYALAHDPLTSSRYPVEADIKSWQRKAAAAAAGGKEGGSSGAGAAGSGAGDDTGSSTWGPFASLPAVPVLAALVDAILQSVPTSLAGAGTDITVGLAGALTSGDGPGYAQAHSGSLSLLFAVLRKLKEAEDAAGSSFPPSIAVPPASANKAMYACSDLAFHMLKARAKDQAAFAPYPGEICLPLSLFRGKSRHGAGSGTSATVPRSAQQAAVQLRPKAALMTPATDGGASSAAAASATSGGARSVSESGSAPSSASKLRQVGAKAKR